MRASRKYHSVNLDLDEVLYMLTWVERVEGSLLLSDDALSRLYAKLERAEKALRKERP